MPKANKIQRRMYAAAAAVASEGAEDPSSLTPSLAPLNLSSSNSSPPTTPPPTASTEDKASENVAELNFLLSESGLCPGKKTSTSEEKKPPYLTGAHINTSMPHPQLLQSHNSSSSSSSASFNPITPSLSQNTNSNWSANSWRQDPLTSPDWDRAGPPGALCAGRVRKDLSTIFTEPLPGIFAVPQEDNMFQVHSLIIGPFDTPYEGGFFHFVVRFGPQYPLDPPRVRFLTTGAGTVRFNPNLYKNGKVCLSILGTWPGPAWSPASNLSTVLLSLQSLMNERPYHNEPGYEEERNPGDCIRYNTIVTHETLRVAVVQQMEWAVMGKTQMPAELRRVMEASFLEYYDHYVDVCLKNMHKDCILMEDPFGEVRGRYNYSHILKQLRKLKARMKANSASQMSAAADESSGPSEIEDDDDDDDDDVVQL